MSIHRTLSMSGCIATVFRSTRAGVGLAVQMVNSGQCKEAVALLDLLLQVLAGC